MEENKDKELKNVTVETYAEDMATILGDDTEGLVKKIIHGEEEQEQEKKNLSPQSKKNKLFMLISLVLLVLALAILSFFLLKKNNSTVSVEKQFTPIIFNDQSVYLEIYGLKKEAIAQNVSTEVANAKVKAGGLEGIYLTENKQMIGLRRFISLIKASFTPGEALLVSDNFLIGGVNTQVNSDLTHNFFILLKVRSSADIFYSIRNWENRMFFDLHGFLGIDIGTDTNYLLKQNFEDGIIENKNARILYDNNHGIALMYIFADDNSVIITNSQGAAHEIILRLAGSKTKQ